MMDNKKSIKELVNTMYDVADVASGYNYWFWKLTNICLDIFKYKNLPSSLPQREIEANLLLTGHCFVFPKNSELVTAVSTIYGFDKYYNPTKATYAQAVLGADSNMNISDYAIIYNSSLKDNVLNIPCDNSLLSFIKRYAKLLSDIESTIDIYVINMRLTSIPVATSDQTKGALRKFFDLLALGKREVVVDVPIIETFRNVDIAKAPTSDNLTELLQARDKILEMFYRDIGVKFRNNKRGNMTVEEVESDTQVLLISLDDMLATRKEGVEDVNYKYGTNIDVYINDRFIVKENTEMKEGAADEDKEVSE